MSDLKLQVQTLLEQHSIIEVLMEMKAFFIENGNFVQGSTNDDYMLQTRATIVSELISCMNNIEGS
jgi:hypothetical protein